MIRSQKDLAEVQQPQQRLTQTEKLLLRYEESRDWMRNNQRIVSGAAVVVVAIVAGLWWWSGQVRANEEHANTYLSRAMMYYLANDYRHAIDGDKTKHPSGEAVYGLRYIV